jgi:hypothetical protein
VKRDASGNFSAGMITADLNGNAATATLTTNAINFTGSMVGDVTGLMGATVVADVGGQTAANVASGTVLSNAATNLNTASTIVKRNASGNFSAGTITAALNGNASTSTNAINFTGSMVGDVTGPMGTTVVADVGGQTAANVASGAVLANAATNLNTASTIMKRDASGNFSAGGATLNGATTINNSTSIANNATTVPGLLVSNASLTDASIGLRLNGGAFVMKVVDAAGVADLTNYGYANLIKINTPPTILPIGTEGQLIYIYNYAVGALTFAGISVTPTKIFKFIWIGNPTNAWIECL